MRIITSTPQKLEEMTADGSFNADLLARLKWATICMPALRNRRADLPQFVDHFIEIGNLELGGNVQDIPADALALLQVHSWPGNMRGLKNVIHEALVRTNGDEILAGSLPDYLHANHARHTNTRLDLAHELTAQLKSGEKDLYRRMTEIMDRVVLATVLQHVNGHQGLASGLLGISRTTLRAKMQSAGQMLQRHVS